MSFATSRFATALMLLAALGLGIPAAAQAHGSFSFKRGPVFGHPGIKHGPAFGHPSARHGFGLHRDFGRHRFAPSRPGFGHDHFHSKSHGFFRHDHGTVIIRPWFGGTVLEFRDSRRFHDRFHPGTGPDLFRGDIRQHRLLNRHDFRRDSFGHRFRGHGFDHRNFINLR